MERDLSDLIDDLRELTAESYDSESNVYFDTGKSAWMADLFDQIDRQMTDNYPGWHRKHPIL